MKTMNEEDRLAYLMCLADDKLQTWGTEKENERIKSEQPDYKHAFVMQDGGDVYNTTSDAEHDPDYDY